MNIQPTVDRTYVAEEDLRWVAPGGQKQMGDADSITLDLALFNLVSTFPNGLIPSGVVLGRKSNGDYGPYAGGTNEVQRVTITGAPAGGTFTLTFEGQTTAPIAFNATAAAVQAALEGLNNVVPGDVVCTGGPLPGTAVDVTFTGNLGSSNRAAMTADGAALTGGSSPAVAITTPTAGTNSAVADGRQTPVGHLRATVPIRPGVTTGKVGAALYWHGEVIESMLPTNHGLDGNAKALLQARIRYI